MVIIILTTQIAAIAISYLSRMQMLVFRMLLVFNIWWAVLLLYSSIVPFGGYRISDSVYLLIWIFLLIFNTVFIFSKSAKNENEGLEFKSKVYSSDFEKKLIKQYDSLIIGNKVLSFVLYLVTGVLIYYALKYSSIMNVDTFLNARNERFYVGGLFGSTLEILFYNYIVSAFRYLFSFVIAFSILFGRMKTKHFIICIFDLAVYAYIGSSRLPVVLLLVDLLIMWIIRSYYGKSTIDRKSVGRSFGIVLTLFLAIFGMSYLTAFRRGSLTFSFESVIDNLEILYQQILEYSIGPLSGLSYLYDHDIMTNHWFFGRAVILGGVEEVISHMLGFLGVHFNYAKNVLGTISNMQRTIGTSTFNALYTCIYWFFSDSGYIGVFFFSGIFAWLEKKGISKFAKQGNIFTMMFAVHILYYMLLSNMIWQIGNVDSLLYMLFVYLFYKRVKKRHIVNGE